MFLNAIGTALPEKCYSKDACWNAFKASDWFARLDARSHAIAKLVLTRNNGIEERWLSVDSLDEVFAIEPDVLHRRFAAHAPLLASAAGLSGLRIAGVCADCCEPAGGHWLGRRAWSMCWLAIWSQPGMPWG